MIPAKAVEAALTVLRRDDLWELSDEEEARLILEAAAPFVLAPLVADLDKWAGQSKPGYYDEAQDDVVQILNPYRSQA